MEYICSMCGKRYNREIYTCENCGSIVYESNSVNLNKQEAINLVKKSMIDVSKQNADEITAVSIFLAIISVCLPILGFMYYFAFRNNYPKTAKLCLIVSASVIAMILLGLGFLFIFIGVIGGLM